MSTPTEEESLTMVDVLEDERQLQEEANAVLGQADDQNCTYDQGYVRRQPLYACLSCSDSSGGVCLACSYTCHENHELVELYTKRSFRCDCGNDNFNGNKCRLRPDKDARNVDNKYNQNFKGLYCTCARPYPDPDDDVEDEMIQCVVCEDWFHTRHLQLSSIPSATDYSEMICFQCCRKYPILQHYVGNENESVDVENVNKNGDGDNSKSKTCPMKSKKLEEWKGDASGKTLFLSSDWRKRICDCDECQKQLAEVSFLRSHEDTVHFYEEMGKDSGDQYEEGMQALSSMERTQQVEAIQSYNTMKSELMDYLKKFAENNKVVREEDIQEFFESMKSRKRRKLDVA